MKLKEIIKLTSPSVLVASLCCLSPLLLFVFGFGSLSFVSGLADVFYYEYKWWFRGAGLLLLITSLVLHFRKKGICTLNDAKRNKNKVINIALMALFSGVIFYLFFLYVVVHYIGKGFNLWI